MNWIDIAWPVLGGTSLMLGLIHLLVWMRQRDQLANLMFGLAAASVAVLAIFELLLMRAQSAAAYAGLLRWAHVPVALLAISLVGFVLLRFRAGRLWLGLGACGLRAAALLANFLTGVNLNFQSIAALESIEVWGGNSISFPMGEPNPWMLLGVLSNLLMIGFLIDAIVSVRQRGDTDKWRRALLVCGSIALFLLLANLWTVALVMQWVGGPLTVNIGFFAVILVMSYELGGDVVRAAPLARQLADSRAQLRASEQRIQLAAHAAGLGLWTWDLDSNESWFTENGNDLLGLAPGENIGRDALLARIHPDDQQVLEQARNDAVSGTGDYACEYRLQDAEGRIRWIAAKGRVEYASSGAPRFIRGVIFDVTERRQAEERFRLVIDGAPVAMLMVDGGGCVTLANAQAGHVFGYSRAELLGASVEMLLPDDSRSFHVEHRHEFAIHPDVRRMGAMRELYARRKDGSVVRVEIGLTPIAIADNAYVLASITDISERLRLEQEAALQREELAHLSRVTLLGELSGSLAHELNQPLTAILSNAQAALRFLHRDMPDLGEVHDSLVQIVENDKRASEVIRRLRALLRKEHVDYELLSINEVVSEVLRLINSDILTRNVAVHQDLAPSLPLISGDRVQLQQVVLNLVINGCDAMEGAGAERSLTVRTELAPGPAVEVSISDTGKGLPTDDPESIFTPFVTSKPDGIGLGLPICRTIIQAHRGTLWAATNPSGGATLHFALPVESNSPDGS